ncbi:protein enabled-like [Saccostrea cucullata]|uniref:protein enabled-like n=1 Tax=Saccostrea cuccullata TaxID=36930 RepID=UPI002ED28C06
MGRGEVRARGKQGRIAVPAMPRPMAILCCILNFLVPGLGTIIAGFTVCCCARSEDMTGCEKLSSFCISFWIGILQILTLPVLLLGWIWSCIWGVSFIGMSNEYYTDNPVMDEGHVIQSNQSNVVITPPRANPHGYPRAPVVVEQPGYPPQQQTHGGYHPGYQQQQYYGHDQPQQSYGATPSAPPAESQEYPHPGPSGYGGNTQPGPYYGEPPPPYSESDAPPLKPPVKS